MSKSHGIESYHPLEQALLLKRGITTKEEAEVFLNPSYERDIADPMGIHNMERAVDRILKAIADKEYIAIYGDYDCDGIPGSVILHDLLKKIGHEQFENYIPHRHKEGYGLNIPAIDAIAARGATLLITVDNGITNVKEVAHAQSLGIDVIVTDHHLPQAILPPAYAVVNSKQTEDTYHDNMLAGAGVAWKLACAILQKNRFGIPVGWEKWLMDMAGLSTVADMVPLLKENRAIAYFGLQVLRKSSRPGLRKLLALAGTPQHSLQEEDIGFTIGPRINAASRMDAPILAFELLATKSEERAEELAKYLTSLNNERKTSVARMMKEIHSILREREPREVIVLGNPEWRIGVVGLAAGKIAEEYQKPVFVWGREGGEMIKGSCRSDGVVNMVDLMVAAGDTFLDKGGHEFSGGFSVSHEMVHVLEYRLIAAHKTLYPEGRIARPANAVVHDAELTMEEVTRTLTDRLSKFAPFGVGNPKPVFLFRGVIPSATKRFGKEKNHVELTFMAGSRPVSAIQFFVSEKSVAARVQEGERIHVYAHIERNTSRFGPPVRLRIIEVIEA